MEGITSNNQFTFTGREKTVLGAFIALGALCLILTYFGNDDALHTRFWTNYLHNSAFFTGIAFLSLFFLCGNIIALSGWYVGFKRIWEASSQFLLVGLVLMAVVVAGVWGDFHHLYHWADADSVADDSILQHKSAFLNPRNFTIFTIGFLAIYYFFARRMRALSLEEDKSDRFDYSVHRKKTRIWAAIFLPLAGFSSAAIIWQWVMSIDAHWYSTLFAWYATISWFISMLAFTVLVIIYLKGRGYFSNVTADHLHDLGKFVFGFSIFWTYLWFSQFMLIWYANVGEETVYFKERFEHYPLLFYFNLAINFLVPFFVLMRNDTKRKLGTMTFVCVIVFFGHWVDYYLMIKPGAAHTAHELLHAHDTHGDTHGMDGHGHGEETITAEHAVEITEHAEHGPLLVAGDNLPGLLELGTFLGFAALFLFIFFNALSRSPLVSHRDPYIDESINHHVV